MIQKGIIALALFSFGFAYGADHGQPRIELESGISVTPQPALINERIVFSAAATGTAPLAYKWFIGGLEIEGDSVFAEYSEAGAFVARLEVTDAGGEKLEQLFRVYVTDTSFDDDLDGVPTRLETELGSNPNNASSKTVTALQDRLVYTPKDLKIKGDPNKPDSDSISGSFAFDRQSATVPDSMTFMISNVIKTFDISSNGGALVATPRSGSKFDKLNLRIKDDFIFATFKFLKGNFLNDINDGALTDINGKRVINIYNTVDAEMYGMNIDLEVKISKSGKVAATGASSVGIPLR